MPGIHDVLRFLVINGHARNDAEREELLGQIDDAEGARKPQKQPASSPKEGSKP